MHKLYRRTWSFDPEKGRKRKGIKILTKLCRIPSLKGIYFVIIQFIITTFYLRSGITKKKINFIFNNIISLKPVEYVKTYLTRVINLATVPRRARLAAGPASDLSPVLE